ncbi:MAG: restriction endonuclease subunit M [Bacteroidales bacterium]|jgi:hypothetical protein|nr:restriction endonuclease subunit M [Bacteroidales bacterium]MDD6960720.1 restriction endonuclease subunit M [Bacteroidales bacterium]MDY6186761.1 restriction endonuclease subunit M [Muribaculaceae bacterium]
MPDFNAVDISETALYDFDHEVLETLLRDHTTGNNILWCTDDYAYKGDGFSANDQITVEKIIGENGTLIRPRALKSKEEQRDRTRDKAEVFTPSWICNAQNNLIDNAWFGREGVFNTENSDRSWTTNPEPITFPEGKTWKDYVRDTRLEITCGEAPYLASRYDTTTGELIPVTDRIGLLDRKLRVINENVDDHEEWLKWVQTAYQNIYGYEWQGDNLLLAREALLQTFFDFHAAKFGEEKPLQMKSVRYIAYIISWNLWQMDGLKGVIPNSCGERRTETATLFGDIEVTVHQCRGCNGGSIREHNGIYALVKDWGAKKERQKIRFIDLIK